MTGTFIARSRPVVMPRWAVAVVVALAALLPFTGQPYLLQIGANSLMYAMLALSLTLVAGTVGQVSLGHAALLAIGGYASGLLALDAGWPVALSIPAAGLVTALLGVPFFVSLLRRKGF